jgi:uncharacterized protein
LSRDCRWILASNWHHRLFATRLAPERVVIHANALVSRLLLPGAIPGQAARKGVAAALPLASDDTIMELAEILARPKFDPYERIPITHVVRACRDPKDDKFLELAVNGAAQLIITGDADLPALHPFRGIDILAPAHYLAPLTGQGADISVIDDPLKPEEALSQTQRQAVNEWAAIARPQCGRGLAPRARTAPRSGAGPPPVVARNLRGVRFNAAYPDRIRAVLACRRCGTS